jgi:hypothetical protein
MPELVWMLWRREESHVRTESWIASHWFIQLVALIVHCTIVALFILVQQTIKKIVISS